MLGLVRAFAWLRDTLVHEGKYLSTDFNIGIKCLLVIATAAPTGEPVEKAQTRNWSQFLGQ